MYFLLFICLPDKKSFPYWTVAHLRRWKGGVCGVTSKKMPEFLENWLHIQIDSEIGSFFKWTANLALSPDFQPTFFSEFQANLGLSPNVLLGVCSKISIWRKPISCCYTLNFVYVLHTFIDFRYTYFSNPWFVYFLQCFLLLVQITWYGPINGRPYPCQLNHFLMHTTKVMVNKSFGCLDYIGAPTTRENPPIKNHSF